MRRLQRILAFLLLCAMLTGSASAAVLPERWHGDLTMEELEQINFDEEAFRSLCNDIVDLSARSQNREALEAMLAELRDMYLLQDTKLTLASIHSDQDVTDTAANETYMCLLEQSYDVQEMMNETILLVLQSEYSDLIDRKDMVFSMFLEEYEPLTEQEKSLYYAEQDLVDAYYAAANETFTTSISGVSYTEDTLYEAYLSGKISPEAYDKGALEIAVAQNEALASIYVELVRNRREQADYYDFQSYASMQDQYGYYRDFSAREIQSFAANVKQYIVPLADSLYSDIQDYLEGGAYEATFTEQELLSLLRMGLTDISEELLPGLDYMEDYGYCDLGWSETKAPGAYTTILPYTAAPYLLMQPDEYDIDFTNIVHEFGHYSAFYCAENLYSYNVDLSEIHSQALELLMLGSYGDVFGADAYAEQLYTVYSILMSMVDGCMMDELERWAYEQEDLTVDMLNEHYMTLLKEYGYYEADDPSNRAYDWVLTPHLFEYPLYYISYGVSAAAAMTIWRQSLTDWQGAVDVYLQLLTYGERGDFYWTLEQVGLGDPLSAESLQEIAVTVGRGIFAAEHTAPAIETASPQESATVQSAEAPAVSAAPMTPAVSEAPEATVDISDWPVLEPEQPLPGWKRYLVPGLCGAGILLLGIVIGILAAHRRRKTS